MSFANQIRVEPSRLPISQIEIAKDLQRRGLTFREIAEMTDSTVKAVEQSLYWDRVR